MSVAPSQRFTAAHPCPVCGGHSALPEGQQRRCWGFLSDDGLYAHCAREEHAGGLQVGPDGMFPHLLAGPCKCGVEHGRAQSTPQGNGSARRGLREAVYRVGDFEHVRREHHDGKKMYWRRLDGLLGLGGVPVAALPLYGVEALADAPVGSTVLVTEGEKAAAALRDRGSLAVGTVTGAKGTPSKSSLEPLARFEPVLWPDADSEGSSHVDNVAARLRSMGITSRVMSWPGAPPHGDAYDFFAAGGTLAALQALIDAATVYGGPSPVDAESPVSGTEVYESTLSMGMVKPRIWSAAELVAADLPEPRWVVPGLLPEGLTLFAGRPKMGKSWLVLSLGIAVAGGGVVLGKVDVLEAGDVLYLALEDNPGRLQSRLRVLLAGAAPPPNLALVTSWPRFSEGGLEALEGWLLAHPTARVVIVDTFAKVRPRRERNGDVFAEDHAAGTMLAGLAAQYHVAIVVVHHQRKMGADDWVDTISGSLGLAAAADSLWALIRERGRADAVLHATGRDVQDQELALVWDTTLASWSLAGPAAEFRLSEERRQILEFIRAAGEPVSPKEVSDALRKNASTTRTLLRKMLRDGELRSAPSATYQPINSVDSVDSVPEMAVSSLRGAGSVDSQSEVFDL